VRYRIGDNGALVPAEASADLVSATVAITLVIGVLFLVAGLRARQAWLAFWGGLTCLCCLAYYLRGWLGFTLPG
jgi:1,4-dihydroxy-2-naphthoate octaprenyltransferase